MTGSIHPTAIIEEGASVSPTCTLWHYVHVREGAQVGDGVGAGRNVYIGKDVRIGDRTRIQNNVSVFQGVTIESDVFVGPSVVFTNDLFPRASAGSWDVVPTVIRRGASLGANATIICGVEIGEFAMVGAGTVVTKDVEPHSMVVGNPSRPIGWVCRSGHRVERAPSSSQPCDCSSDTTQDSR